MLPFKCTTLTIQQIGEKASKVSLLRADFKSSLKLPAKTNYKVSDMYTFVES